MCRHIGSEAPAMGARTTCPPPRPLLHASPGPAGSTGPTRPSRWQLSPVYSSDLDSASVSGRSKVCEGHHRREERPDRKNCQCPPAMALGHTHRLPERADSDRTLQTGAARWALGLRGACATVNLPLKAIDIAACKLQLSPHLSAEGRKLPIWPTLARVQGCTDALPYPHSKNIVAPCCRAYC